MTHPIIAYCQSAQISQRDFAAQVGFHETVVSRWATGDRIILPEQAQKVHRFSGIPLHELRPDIWNPPEAKAERAAS